MASRSERPKTTTRIRFILAKTTRAAENYHVEYEGYEPGDAEAVLSTARNHPQRLQSKNAGYAKAFHLLIPDAILL